MVFFNRFPARLPLWLVFPVLFVSALANARTEIRSFGITCEARLSSTYAAGRTEIETREQQQAMRLSGRDSAFQVLRKHQSVIDPKHSVLEFGPYFNGFSEELVSIFGPQVQFHDWDISYKGLEHTLNRDFKHDLERFHPIHIDLNSLADEATWQKYLDFVGTKKFDLIIASSFLNYVDSELWLNRMRDLLSDEGLLLIANSPYGTPGYFHPARLIGANRLQYWLQYGGGRDVFDVIDAGGASSFKFGVEINQVRLLKKRSTGRDIMAPTRDLYLEFWRELNPTCTTCPVMVTDAYAQKIISLTDEQIRIRENQENFDVNFNTSPAITSEQVAFLRASTYLSGGTDAIDAMWTAWAQLEGHWQRNQFIHAVFWTGRLDLIRYMYESAPQDVAKVFDKYQHTITRRFAPELRTFILSLNLAKADRPAFIRHEIEMLYRSLNHPVP